MALSVTDLLELPVVARARPVVVTGEGLDERTVRWVHTSEIYDISPLLKGGEVLLTTGLGLVGVDPGSVRRYVSSLAGIGIAALFLELGRTFTSAPPALVAAARDEQLPLVVLHSIVPFIEITEVAHARLLSDEVHLLRAGHGFTDTLLAGMTENTGLPGLVAHIAALAGCAVGLVSTAGVHVAGTAVLDEHDAAFVVPIDLGGSRWGSLVVAEPMTPERSTLLARASPLVALELQRSGAGLPSRDQAGAELLLDIVHGRYSSTGEVSTRAAGVGFVVPAGQKVVALCVSVSGAAGGQAAVAAARTAGRRVFGTALVGPYEDGVLVAAAVSPRDLRATLASFADAVAAELAASSGGRFVVSAGPLVDDLAGLVRSAPAARETAVLARRLTPSAELVLAADFALYQLLASLVDDAALEQFVGDQLGALIDHDARTGAELVRTLDTYLASGLSKSRAAESLGIRRQTLYGRLERISMLLDGLDLANRERRIALDLALVSWRLRTSAASRGLARVTPR